MRRFFVLALALGGLAIPSSADTFYVNGSTGNDAWDGRCQTWDGGACGPKKTIQSGINAAGAGDTVLIADATYTGPGNKNLDFAGRLLTVRSASGHAEACVIDCQNDGRGFLFQSAEPSECIIADLTITNGAASPALYGKVLGGAICVLSGRPTIRGCRLLGNRAATASAGPSGGGAVYGSAVLESCEIRDNWTDSYGGGIFGDVHATDCEIRDNIAYLGGGAYLGLSAAATIERCRIEGNLATWGGGVSLSFGAQAIDCVFQNNTAGTGGGLRLGDGAIVSRCAILGNRALSTGGGFDADNDGSGETRYVDNCLIAGNSAGYLGGAIHQNACEVVLTNCTVAGNMANGAAGIDLTSASLVADNCIVYDNATQQIGLQNQASAQFAFSDIQGGWPGTGNIDRDPGFAFSADSHLIAGSPCIDAGTNTPGVGLSNTDLDGNPRRLPTDGVADMGCYEFNSLAPSIAASSQALLAALPLGKGNPPDKTLGIRNAGGGTLDWQLTGGAPWLTIVPTSGQSAGEVNIVTLSFNVVGLSHGDHTCDLTISDPQAINDPITVAVTLRLTGTLRVPSEYATIQAAADAAVDRDLILLANGTYSGPGNCDIDLRGRDVVLRSASGHPESCIIDAGGKTAFYLYRNEPASVTLSGFTVRNGAGGMYYHERAGITLVSGSSPTITNCRFVENTTAALFIDHSSHPLISHCVFASNTTNTDGAGIFTQGSVTLRECTFQDNSTRLTPDYYYHGGALVGGTFAQVTLENCSFINNHAGCGGAIGCSSYEATFYVNNCIFAGNTAVSAGGAIACSDYGTFYLRDSIFWNNAAPSGAQLALVRHNRWPWLIDVAYCDVPGGAAGVYIDPEFGQLAWGPGNIDADPLWLDPGANDFHLLPGSPCIDAGSPAFVLQPGQTDLDGQRRLWDGNADGLAIVDMGMDEFGSLPYGDMTCNGVVNNQDIDAFVEALFNAAAYIADHPNCNILLADFTADGLVNNQDIDGFLATLFGW